MTKPRPKKDAPLAAIREAFAEYHATEGCSCCSDYYGHKDAAERLGKLLRVPRFKDGSGRDFSRFRVKVSRAD